MAAHRRHDISDKEWANIEKLLSGSKGSIGLPSADNRLLINAVFWILRTGAPWRDLPSHLGDWKIHIDAFVDGEIGGFGKKYLKISLSNLILNGSSLMPAIAKFIRMGQALRKVMRQRVVQKGAQLKNTSGRGCAWYAGQSCCSEGVPELIAKRPVR